MKNVLLSPRHFSKYQADSSFSTQIVSAQGAPSVGQKATRVPLGMVQKHGYQMLMAAQPTS